MNTVEAIDGRSRSKKRKDMDVIDGGDDDLVSEISVVGQQNMAVMQFEANLVEDAS